MTAPTVTVLPPATATSATSVKSNSYNLDGYNMEYVDLYGSDEEPEASFSFTNSAVLNQAEEQRHTSKMDEAAAEFYCFDDYHPVERSFIDDTYVRLSELPLYIDESHSKGKRRSLSRATAPHLHQSKSQPQFHTDKDISIPGSQSMDNGWTIELHNSYYCGNKPVISRKNSGSSTSTSASSNTSTAAAASLNESSIVPPPLIPRHNRDNHSERRHYSKKKLNHTISGVPLLSRSRAPEVPPRPPPISTRSSSSQPIRYPHMSASCDASIFSQSQSMTTTSIKSNNTDNINQRKCPRTEQLLNGIVKLVEDDVLTQKPRNTQPTTKSTNHSRSVDNNFSRKKPLQPSKSTPIIAKSKSEYGFNATTKSSNSQSKPSSPTSVTRRFPFSRKNSFSAQHSSSDNDKKTDRKSKSSDKLSHVEPAVFLDAVEHFDVDLISSLMSIDKSCINCLSPEGFTAMDVAVLTNHVPMILVLNKYGAKTKVCDELLTDNNLCVILQSLIQRAEYHVKSLQAVPTTTNSTSLSKENERKLNQWEYKHRLFRRMKTGYEQAGLPGQPQNVKISVTSDSSLNLRFDGPENTNGAAVIRYKVEWSKSQNFKSLTGEVFINDLQNLQHNITGLDSGTAYYVRVTAWNLKGFGKPSYSDPLYAIPSSWRDVESIQSRSSSYDLHKVGGIIASVRKHRSAASSSEGSSGTAGDSPTANRKSSTSVPLMKGLRGLFSSSFKFQKSLKRGIYLACVCYSEDKILVTTEDNLPIVEVDETYSGSPIQTDFDWLMKVLASSLDTVKQLKQDLEKISELTSVQLKYQLLSAVLQLQETMGIPELGKLFYKPISDGNGSIVFAVINHITDAKQTANISSAVKWQTQSKLIKNSNTNDPLLSQLNEMLFYHRVSSNHLKRGLYLGYLHVKINVEAIRVLAPETYPSVLPYTRVRECPNVSQPEWQALLNLVLSSDSGDSTACNKDSPDITLFKKQLMKSAKKLVDKLGVSKHLAEHRFYDVEVLDLSKDVSFILLLPPRDLVCSIHSQPSTNADEVVTDVRQDYMEIPVKVFETLHLQTYHNHFMNSFANAIGLIDAQLMITQQTHREAFSTEELERSKKNMETMKSYQQQLEEMWRATRWLMDAISYARDRTSQGISVKQLYDSIVEQSSMVAGSEIYGKGSDDGYHSDKHSIGGSTASEKIVSVSTESSGRTNNTNNNNGQYYDGELDYHHNPSAGASSKEELNGMIRVYAAYNSGLNKGSSVLLHVGPKSTAREVVELVVTHLNHAVVLKGSSGPLYRQDELEEFCLVAIIGPRERVLRDDYKLLQLQNPWTKGKLYVRHKDNLLAALEHGETTDV